jgi:hypothetical protein
MWRFRCLTLVSLCLLLSACANDSSETTGVKPAPVASPLAAPLPDVATMVKRMTTQDGSRDFIAEMRMTAETASGKRDQVEFKLQRKYTSDGARTFLTVLAPREETDKALLAIEQNAQPTEAFSYLPGLKKLAKVGSDRQLNFRGAKVTIQELLGLELNQYTHDAGTRTDEGLIKVEFEASPTRQLAFPRIVGLFREADQSPARFELYDDRNELQKTLLIEEVKTIQAHQTITRVAIEDLPQKLKLRLETRRIEYDRNLPDRLFTEEHLKTFTSSASHKLDQ